MVRFASIGSSNHAHTFLKAALTCEEFHLEAVYSRSINIAQEMAEKYSVGKAYDNLEQIAKDPEIDAVYIASPNAFHAQQAIYMMDAGKHVLCEKTLASNEREVLEMFAAAERNNVILLEATKPLHDPCFDMIRQALPKIGKVRHASLRFCQYSSRYDDFLAGIDHNVFDKNCSAGALWDLGVYPAQFMVGLFGQPQNVQASCLKLRTGVDGLGSVIAEYEDMLVTLLYSKIGASDMPSDIIGEQGNMWIYPSTCEPERLEIHYKDGRIEKMVREPAPVHPIVFEVQDFIDMVNGKKDNKKFKEISIESIRTMDAIRKQFGIVFPADER